MFGSFATTSRARTYRPASASPRTSMGLPWLQWGGRTVSRASIVSSESFANSPPSAIRASVASTPGPPAFVMMARRAPLGRDCLASTSAI